MLSKMFRGAAALALAAACLQTHAASVTLSGWAYGNGNTVKSTMYQGEAGGFVGELSGAGQAFDASPFLTYCVELTEYFSFSSTPLSGYEVVGGSSYFGASKSSALGRLLTYVSDNPTQVDTAAESTSLQLAIWNIVYDTDLSVSSAGIFRDISTYGAQANVLLTGAQGVASSKYDIYALRRDGSQDFLLTSLHDPQGSDAATVAEPASVALVAVALGALGFSRRRPARG